MWEILLGKPWKRSGKTATLSAAAEASKELDIKINSRPSSQPPPLPPLPPLSEEEEEKGEKAEEEGHGPQFRDGEASREERWRRIEIRSDSAERRTPTPPLPPLPLAPSEGRGEFATGGRTRTAPGFQSVPEAVPLAFATSPRENC